MESSRFRSYSVLAIAVALGLGWWLGSPGPPSLLSEMEMAERTRAILDEPGILERRLSFSGYEVVAISPDPQRPRGVAIGVAGQGLVLSEDTGLTTVILRESRALS